MDYVRLGDSNLRVSRLSLGAMSFGDPAWRPWTLDLTAARSVFNTAADAGINLIDTCNFYSKGVSEEIVGALLKEHDRNDWVVATKVGYHMRDAATAWGFSRKHLFEQVDASLKRLQTDHIDLYQTHIWDPNTNLEEMVVAFDDIVRSGKVRYVGATDMPARQFVKSVTMAKERGLAHFVSMQNHYNLIWREDERELIPFCRENGIGLLPYSPHARGFLSGKARRQGDTESERHRTDEFAHKWYGRSEDDVIANKVASIAAEIGATMSQVSLAWVLAQPGIHSPVIGATAANHVSEAVDALQISLGEEYIRALDSLYVPRPATSHI